MSRFSGKYDLYDYMIMHGKSDDELECFECFKESTQGKLYQPVLIKLTSYNIDNEIKLCNNENILRKDTWFEEVPDNRFKCGYRQVQKNKYYFYNEEMTLDEINKRKYYGLRTIHFNTLLDLIPYYPYLIIVATANNVTCIEISSKNYVDVQEDEMREYGHSPSFLDYYRSKLQEHYIEVVNKYCKEN